MLLVIVFSEIIMVLLKLIYLGNVKKYKLKMKNLQLTAIAIFGLLTISNAQSLSKKVLFLGNSYTGVNDLPQMVANVATSMGDNLTFDSNTPGGHTLQGHSTNATSLAKIGVGNWDYVVLQEQSQLPSFSDAEVEANVFPYAQTLDNIINTQNPCAETVFYMTWGRKNGDASNCASWPPVCTYVGMDNLLNLRYKTMADNNNGIVSPVGAVWKYIRENFPLIELYQSDESHPSLAGTYAAACCFYTVLYKKDPTLITFNSTLSTVDAANIRAATKLIVYNNLAVWHVGEYDPSANFSYTNNGGGQINFTNNSVNATTYLWDFGDGTTSIESNPSHTYVTTGSFTVTLLTSKCGVEDSKTEIINIGTLGAQTHENDKKYLNIYPNPAKNSINLQVDLKLIGCNYVVNDTGGKTVLTGIINSENTIIELGNLSKGIYLINVGENLKQTFKVIKE